MTTLTYSISRKAAAKKLGISTRTVDRYVKKGKLSYKKVANKVLLAEEEIDDLQDEFALLHQEPQQSELVKEATTTGLSRERLSSSKSTGSVKEFAQILSTKDKTIEEKNQLIFMLQRKLGEMETKLKSMVALPDHSAQKEKLMTNIQHLELENYTLQ